MLTNGATQVMAGSYRPPGALASFGKDGAAPYRVTTSGDAQPHPGSRNKKMLDRFRDKMHAIHYASATEKSCCHWIVELLRIHRMKGEWRHPSDRGKPEFEAFITHPVIAPLRDR
jgi:hypothetical protein